MQTAQDADGTRCRRHKMQTTQDAEDTSFRRHKMQATQEADDTRCRGHTVQKAQYADDTSFRRHKVFHVINTKYEAISNCLLFLDTAVINILYFGVYLTFLVIADRFM